MKIKKNTVVTLDYIVKDDSGNLIDTSQASGPIKYLHGYGNLIPALEKELEGKERNDKINVKILAKDAYGEVNLDLIKEVSKDLFEDPENLQTGMEFQVQDEKGSYILTIKEVKGDTVIVDGNHPLAGKNLNFEINILDIRDATSEEIAHGHVH